MCERTMPYCNFHVIYPFLLYDSFTQQFTKLHCFITQRDDVSHCALYNICTWHLKTGREQGVYKTEDSWRREIDTQAKD